MTRYGIIAARDVPDPGLIEEIIKGIGSDDNIYVSGGDAGGVAVACTYLATNWPKAKHFIMLPTKKDKGKIDKWWERVSATTHFADNKGFISDRDRTRDVVICSDMIYAFPGFPEDDKRNGKEDPSWMVVRMARRRNLPLHITVLDTFESWTENL